MRALTVAAALAAVLFVLSAPTAGTDAGNGVHWPSFRGVQASGVADGFDVPTSWNVETGENVRWKTPIPGLGLSSPVVWGDTVFVTTAVREKGNASLKVGLYGDIKPVKDDSAHEFKLFALDKKSGKVLWERTAHAGVPQIKRHTKASHANSTPATDGKIVVAFFGSEGLYAYDMKGKLRWKVDLGKLRSSFFMVPDAEWGYGASPVIHDGKVIVQCDVIGDSFLAAFDAGSGKELWRTTREDYPTWSTPTILEHDGRTLVIVNGYKHIGAYDLKDGKEVWKLKGGGDIPVPTPIVAHGLVYVTNGHGASPIFAIRPGAKGDISLADDETSNAGVAWSSDRNGAYMPTPVVVGDVLYVLRDQGVLGAYDAVSGEELYRNRVGSGKTGYTASLVAANGHVYVTSEEGDILVLKAGREYVEVGTYAMDEVCMATPAISAGALLVRTRGHLVSIAKTGTLP